MSHVARGRQRSGEGAEPIDTSITLGKRRGRIIGRFDLVTLDVDPYGASPVVGDLGECFDDLIGTKWTSLVPSVRVGVKVLEPGRENAWRVPGVFKLQEDPVKAGDGTDGGSRRKRNGRPRGGCRSLRGAIVGQ